MICIILVAGHGVVLEKEIQVGILDSAIFAHAHTTHQEDDTRKYNHLIGIPKALLPARPDNGETILDYWWNALKRYLSDHTHDHALTTPLSSSRQQFSEVYLVTNADKYEWCDICEAHEYGFLCRYKHYERWASAHEFPLSNIINDGSTTYENR